MRQNQKAKAKTPKAPAQKAPAQKAPAQKAPAPKAPAPKAKAVPRKVTGLKRSSVLEQPTKNTLKRRGYFAGQEIVDATRQHLEPDELKAFFDKVRPDAFWYPYFFIEYYFGCRLSEPALILDIDDVSDAKQQIVIKRLKKTSEEDGYKAQVYSADSRILDAIHTVRRWKIDAGLADNPFLFPSRRKQKVTGAERLSQLRNLEGWQAVSRFTAHRKFQAIAKACKLPSHLCHSHVLRHTRATLMLANGVTPESVQWLLGHSSIKMTWRYMGVAESLRARLNKDAISAGLGL